MAAEVIRLNGVILELTAATNLARLTYERSWQDLNSTVARRNALAFQMREAQIREAPAIAKDAAPTGAARAGGRPERNTSETGEASVRTVQNVLFALGGILLATAAIVFTAVAWNMFGLSGRAMILATVTLLALGASLAARRRNLVATAETFAALGVLLILLDGYAAWYVNLLGLAAAVSSTTFAAGIFAVTAAVAISFGRLTGPRLTGPRIAGVLAAQPVPLLLLADAALNSTGWAFALALLAAANLTSRRWASDLVRGLLWIMYGSAAAAGIAFALHAEAVAESLTGILWAGLALVAVVGVFVVAAAVAGDRSLRQVAAGSAALAVAFAAGRLAVASQPGLALVLAAAVAVAVAVLAGLVVPAQWRDGARTGAGVALVAVGAVAVMNALVAAGGTVWAAQPPWHADLDEFAARAYVSDWRLLAAVALVAAGAGALMPRSGWPAAAVSAAGLAALALPSAVRAPWWSASSVDLLVMAPLVLLAIRRTGNAPIPNPPVPPSSRDGWRVWSATAAGMLALHAVVAGLARPSSTAWTLWSIVVIGTAMLSIERHQVAGRRHGTEARKGTAAGAAGIAIAIVTLPAATLSTIAAFAVRPISTGAGALIAAAVGTAAVLAVRRWAPWQIRAAALGASGAVLFGSSVVPIVDARLGPYSAIGLLLLAAVAFVVVPVDRSAVWPTLPAAIVPLLRVLLAVVPAAFAVLIVPYSWLAAIWSGAPGRGGPGLSPNGSAVGFSSAAALAILTVAAGLAVTVAPAASARATRTGRPAPAARRAAIGGLSVAPLAVLVTLAATGAPWPTVPLATLALGIAGALVAALGDRRAPARMTAIRIATVSIAVAYAVALTGAGLAGLLPTRGTTLLGLGVLLVAMVVIAAAAPAASVRTLGGVAAVIAGMMFAIAATRAAGLPARAVSLAVLGIAGIALAAGTWLRGRRATALRATALQPTGLEATALRPTGLEATALEAAGHAAAVVAVLLVGAPFATGAAISHTALLFTLWGIALGLSAVAPAQKTQRRWRLAVAAVGCELIAWWLLLAAGEVALVEAYTLPAAVVATAVGTLALRRRPELGSWVAYGPALAAAFLPSLASGVAVDEEPLRRLLLGVGAVAVVLAGATRRRQAPVAVGGGVLIVLALRELVRIWDLVPRWIPLALAGMLLVGLAMTYERRRRDLARLRDGFGRMS